MERLQRLASELAVLGPQGSQDHIHAKVDALANTFNAFKDTVREK